MNADDTFTAYELYYDDEMKFVVDSIKGTWKPLINQSAWWDGYITSLRWLCLGARALIFPTFHWISAMTYSPTTDGNW